MLLIYKPSNFITFNDLQDTCSITGQPFYLNHVGFQQTYSFPGHLAPQFWLVSTQLILSIVIRHLYFRWPPDNLLLSQSSSTQHHNNIKIYTIHWLLRKVWVSWKRHFPTGLARIFPFLIIFKFYSLDTFLNSVFILFMEIKLIQSGLFIFQISTFGLLNQ